jgi:hypothetical protein
LGLLVLLGLFHRLVLLVLLVRLVRLGLFHRLAPSVPSVLWGRLVLLGLYSLAGLLHQ